MAHSPFHVPHGEVNRSGQNPAGPKLDPRARFTKKGTWREAKFPLSIAMVPKAGFEPAQVSPPPPQDGASAEGSPPAAIRQLS